jgi:hypothetical protein
MAGMNILLQTEKSEKLDNDCLDGNSIETRSFGIHTEAERGPHALM